MSQQDQACAADCVRRAQDRAGVAGVLGRVERDPAQFLTEIRPNFVITDAKIATDKTNERDLYHALDELAPHELIVRHKGKQSFVAPPKVNEHFAQSLTGLAEAVSEVMAQVLGLRVERI